MGAGSIDKFSAFFKCSPLFSNVLRFVHEFSAFFKSSPLFEKRRTFLPGLHDVSRDQKRPFLVRKRTTRDRHKP
ncbi:hypothetical protein IV203_026907 [Nitzschia inconspicua]|uniref:Uncharacterized protein n=1 Tax=Nitzschia inconspicua TaxID=303405 RepID=A0A9K3LMK1_9STRA|nr:hypothetical protein IV203_026907 [Nitzschia inconspicua]